jgi:hypothetical protein
MLKIVITPELRQSIETCRAVIQGQVDAHNASGATHQDIPARAQLADALPVLAAIANHWGKSMPTILGRQLAPFNVQPDDFRHLVKACGATRASESLRDFQPHRGPVAEQIKTLFAIFDRALQGRVFLTQDLPCEKDTTP